MSSIILSISCGTTISQDCSAIVFFFWLDKFSVFLSTQLPKKCGTVATSIDLYPYPLYEAIEKLHLTAHDQAYAITICIVRPVSKGYQQQIWRRIVAPSSNHRESGSLMFRSVVRSLSNMPACFMKECILLLKSSKRLTLIVRSGHL